jgi:hypothetical protein
MRNGDGDAQRGILPEGDKQVQKKNDNNSRGDGLRGFPKIHHAILPHADAEDKGS